MTEQQTATEPYENSLSVDDLRREVRECWDREHEIRNALRDAPVLPSGWLLKFLGDAGKWPDDYSRGKELQREHGLDAVPPKTECEIGAGLWDRIRRGLTATEGATPKEKTSSGEKI